MKDNELLHARYPDLFPGDETADPALERLITDLETVYPPASYPASLPERLISALETHIERDEPASAERPLANAPARLRSLRKSHDQQGKRWQRRFSTFLAAALTILLIGSLLFVLHESRQAGQPGANVTGNPSPNAYPTSEAFPGVLAGISMINLTTGWAESDTGLGSVFHTTDGGFHWQNVTPQHLITPGYDLSPNSIL